MYILLRLHNIEIEVRNFNNDFLLLRSTVGDSLEKIAKAIFERQFDFIEEVIFTEVEICLKLNTHFKESKIALLQQIEFQQDTQQSIYKLPVCFNDHKDWGNVIATTGFSKNETIEKLTAMEFSIAMFGFIPGFIYFNGLDTALHIPRKTIPAKYVAANSLAIGGKYLGLYSLASPGGWHVIGQVAISILQIPKLPPVALNLGDTIKLHSISEKEFEVLKAQKATLENWEAIINA